MSQGDGSEFSPVSFHGSLKVDFEPVSVKLGLIATTGATHSTYSRGKMVHFLTVAQGLLLYAEDYGFSRQTRQFDVTTEAICLGLLFLFFFSCGVSREVARYVGNA